MKRKKRFWLPRFCHQSSSFSFLFLSSSFSFIFFFTSLTKWTKCVNCLSSLKISLSSYRAFSLSIVLVFNKIASPYQLEKSKCLLSHYFKNFNLKPYNRFTDWKVLYVLIAVKLSLIRRIKSVLMEESNSSKYQTVKKFIWITLWDFANRP